MNRTVKMLLVARKDLNLPDNMLAIQVAHAAMYMAVRIAISEEKTFHSWGMNHYMKELYRANSLLHLQSLNVRAEEMLLPRYLFTDTFPVTPVKGQVRINGARSTTLSTVLAIGPCDAMLINELISVENLSAW